MACNFHETGYVCLSRSWCSHLFSVPYFTLGMDVMHNHVQLLVNFICIPAQGAWHSETFLNPEVATPPAFTALPGAYITFFSKNKSMASGVQPILEISPMQITLFLVRFAASSPFNSFCGARRCYVWVYFHGRLSAKRLLRRTLRHGCLNVVSGSSEFQHIIYFFTTYTVGIINIAIGTGNSDYL